jgi:hypothetical protein
VEPHVKGGIATREKYTRVCERCGQLVPPSEEFARLGSKGGSVTLKRYGRRHMSEIGKKGGRPRLEAK